jgi:hypothetical protein
MTRWAKVEYGEGTIEALAEMGIDAEKEVNRALAKDYIIQLAEQAGWMMGDEPEGFNTRLVKFADLIVRECAEIAKTAEPYRSDDLILRHFGVEPNE